MKKAEDLQAAADEHDVKRFYTGLKSILGPQSRSTTPIFFHDGSNLLTKHEDILQRWADRFNLVLNRTVLDDPQLACEDHLATSPDVDEVSKAIQQMSSGKACGLDGLPAEIFKHDGRILV